MKRIFCFLIVLKLLIPVFHQVHNSLTPKEKKEGWILLFDGKSVSNWQSASGKPFQSQGWTVQDGILIVKPVKGSQNGGDVVTLNEYSDFEFMVDFRTTVGANSGIKYFYTNYKKGGRLGCEFQILDDEVNADAKLGIGGNRVCGAFYDMLAPLPNRKVNAFGEWNTARIVSKGKHVEHWLNGIKILEYERGSEIYMQALAKSKFKDVEPVFGLVPKGRILLQDHGTEVWFRNIKIRTL